MRNAILGLAAAGIILGGQAFSATSAVVVPAADRQTAGITRGPHGNRWSGRRVWVPGRWHRSRRTGGWVFVKGHWR
jgi:hypothetical protein